MRVVFTDETLGAACCHRRRIDERWGDAAPDIRLALCTLQASRDLRRFLALPNVTQEKNVVIFTARTSTIHLTIEELVHADGDPMIAITELAVGAPTVAN